MNEAFALFGWDLIGAVVGVALLGGLLSDRTGSGRAVGVFVGLGMLSLGWLTMAAFAYVAVNLGSEAWEGLGGTTVPHGSRLLGTKWLAFASVVAFYAKYVWEERHTPARFKGPRLVVGRVRTRRNLPAKW